MPWSKCGMPGMVHLMLQQKASTKFVAQSRPRRQAVSTLGAEDADSSDNAIWWCGSPAVCYFGMAYYGISLHIMANWKSIYIYIIYIYLYYNHLHWNCCMSETPWASDCIVASSTRAYLLPQPASLHPTSSYIIYITSFGGFHTGRYPKIDVL